MLLRFSNSIPIDLLPSPAIRLLLRRFALLMGVYTLLRLGFYLFNRGTFRGIDPSSIFLAFTRGLRFDIAAILWLNLPLVVLSLLVPVSVRRGQRWLRGFVWRRGRIVTHQRWEGREWPRSPGRYHCRTCCSFGIGLRC